MPLAIVRPDHDDEMGTQDNHNGSAGSDETELRVSHFIPSVELKGSRAKKLQKLDTLIAYLERLRRTLAADTVAGRTGYEGPSRYIDTPVWPWLAAGIVLGALFVLLVVLAWSYA